MGWCTSFKMGYIQFDVVSNREVISRLRSLAVSIPMVWAAYRQYWRLRRWLESSKKYPISSRLLSFGNFPIPTLDEPGSQLCTAEQMLSSTYDIWCDAIHSPPRFSRKQWEFVFIMQALDHKHKLAPSMSGLGFGCGREPLPGLFASRGCSVLATDLDSQAACAQGWVHTMQHSASLEELYKSAKRILPSGIFFKEVSFQSADMNHIPEEFIEQFDFVWSACALEHLGSLRHGMEFIKNSLTCLKPGGVAVHTTEFNLSSLDQTLETPSCSIFREKDIRELISEVQALGYVVEPLNLNTGNRTVDRYIDLPPYGSPHIKLELEGYVVTSIGLIIQRPN
jgi:2-polyprenyl-3-methyl-5-hydroxy-6-metoxy-1,4-benzoquinol methylase